MEFTYKIFDKLNDDIKNIRQTVFVTEQGFNEEFDTIDNNKATHMVFYDGKVPAGVCRFFTDDGKEYHIGRVAVMAPYRKFGLGKMIMNNAEKEIKKSGGESIALSAQCRVIPFYEKCGYAPYGDVYLDEHCPHRMMKKSL